jgi:hypothetical protein
MRTMASFQAVELATFECVDWFNSLRPPAPIGNLPPNEVEERYYAMPESQPRRHNLNQIASGKRGAVQSHLLHTSRLSIKIDPLPDAGSITDQLLPSNEMRVSLD